MRLEVDAAIPVGPMPIVREFGRRMDEAAKADGSIVHDPATCWWCQREPNSVVLKRQVASITAMQVELCEHAPFIWVGSDFRSRNIDAPKPESYVKC